MKSLRIALILLALFQAGWIVLDGSQALRTGRYLTPRVGAYGGRIGPWTRVASALGAPARSVEAKWALVIYGAAWLGATIAYARRSAGAWWAMFVCAGGALWYSSLSVPLSLAQMLLLVVLRRDA